MRGSRHSRGHLRVGPWAWALAALALLVAPAAQAELVGRAGPYTVRVQMQPETPVVGDNRARVRVLDGSGQPVRGARVSVTTEMLDMPMGSQVTQAAEGDTGVYTAPVSLSMGGNWRLKVAVDGPAGKGDADLKVTTGVSTAGSGGAGLPWPWIGAAVVALILLLVAIVRRGRAPRQIDRAGGGASERTARLPGHSPVIEFVRHHFWGVAVILLAIVVAGALVRKYKKPGQLTVLEGQSMDMSGMKAPVGAVPVTTETVEPGVFESAVTYTGSVVSEADEDVYPRVVGRITWMPLYPGDRVAAGQVIARLDSAELTSKVDEASADRAMKQYESGMARAGMSQAESQRREAEARALKVRTGVRDAESQVAAAEGALRQARSDLDAARSDLSDAQSQQVSAEQDREQAQAGLEGARASLSEAEAGVTTARANLAYWQEEIKRAAALLKSGAISQEEYDRERSQYESAQAGVQQAQQRVRSMQSGVRGSEARIRQTGANITGAQARADRARANIAGAQAKVDQAQAALASATARVAQARADVEEADAAVRTAGEAVRVAEQNASRGAAGEQQAAASERTASIVRGYTEIRASGSGRVIQRLVSPGVLVNPGTPILKIAHIDRVRLQANVAQSDLGSIRAGNPVRVTSQKDPSRQVITRLTSVFPAADPASRTGIIEALTPNPGSFFLPGEFVTLRITTGEASTALSVPIAAVADLEGKPAVWTVKGGKARRVAVTAGRTDGERTQILSGLKAGDTVITGGHTDLKPGDTVLPTQWGDDGPPDSALRRQPPAANPEEPMTGMDGATEGSGPQPPTTGHEGH